MDTLRFAEVSALHLEPETFAQLRALADTQPSRPGGFSYDADNPWHQLIVEPHTYGCWVHTGIVEDGPTELPASLISVLRDAFASDAVWVLFDSDLTPLLDLPVFEHPNPAPEPTPRRVVFSYQMPVHVEVEDGQVGRVTVIDETPVRDPVVVEGDADYLADAVAAADDGQAWPSWRFGY